MSYRDGETGYRPPHRRERPPTRLEWTIALIGSGAALLLFAASSTGRALLHIDKDHAGLVQSLAAAWMCADFVLISLWQGERSGAATPAHRRFIPFILVAIGVATLLAIGTILFEA